MRRILFFWVFIFLCFSCSGHDYVEEYEKEEVLDTVNIIESGDSTSDTSNDSTVDDGTVKFRTFSVLGNSISTYSGYIPSGYANYYTPSRLSVEDTWWMLLSAKEDLELASNASWAGSSVANKSGKNANSYFTSEMRINALAVNGIPDVIFILGGTNDWGDNSGYLGDYPINDNYDLKTFRGHTLIS